MSSHSARQGDRDVIKKCRFCGKKFETDTCIKHCKRCAESGLPAARARELARKPDPIKCCRFCNAKFKATGHAKHRVKTCPRCTSKGLSENLAQLQRRMWFHENPDRAREHRIKANVVRRAKYQSKMRACKICEAAFPADGLTRLYCERCVALGRSEKVVKRNKNARARCRRESNIHKFREYEREWAKRDRAANPERSRERCKRSATKMTERAEALAELLELPKPPKELRGVYSRKFRERTNQRKDTK